MADVFLALGSNMGEREINLVNAIKLISSSNFVYVTNISDIYETEPVGGVEQDKFLNMALEAKTVLNPSALLEELQRIEILLKRTRELHWGPRTMDIDILLYDKIRVELPNLTIPHPRMFERAFVLIPLSDIYTDKTIDDRNIYDLIEKCSDKDGVKLYKKLTINDIKIF